MRATRPTLVTGYDAQNREIWSRTTFGKLASVGSSRDVYIGNTSARYFFGQGGKADSVCQYDEQGRLYPYGNRLWRHIDVLLPRRCD